METDRRIEKIADHYGYESQSNQLIEEMAELTQAINKWWRKLTEMEKIRPVNPVEKTPTELIDHIAEEIADVGICLEQVEYLLGIECRVERYREKKLERQLRRMKGAEQ